MSNYTSRRLAFWDNCAHDLQNFLRDIEARRAEKFINGYDMDVINSVCKDIKNAMLNCFERYGIVVNDFIVENREVVD